MFMQVDRCQPARAGRSRHRADPRAKPRRAAWRHGRRPQRRTRQGQRVHRGIAGSDGAARSTARIRPGARRRFPIAASSWWTTIATPPTRLRPCCGRSARSSKWPTAAVRRWTSSRGSSPMPSFWTSGCPRWTASKWRVEFRAAEIRSTRACWSRSRAGARRHDVEQSRVAGFDHHFVKPLNVDALRDMLMSADTPDA